MSAGKVEFVLAAEDSKAIQAATKLLEKVRQTGDAFDQVGKKGQKAHDSIGDSIMGVVSRYAAWATVLKTVNDLSEKQLAHLAAINRENEKSAGVSKSYGEAMQRVVTAGGAGNVAQVDQLLRGTAGKFSLGEGGLVKLTDAYGRIQAKGGDLSQAQRGDLLTEAAKMLQLNQGMDAIGYAGGMTDLVGASGGKLTATQANALLRQIQQRGGIGELGTVAGAHDKLARTAQIGGISMTDMGALAATVTKTSGEDMLEKLPDVVAKIKYRGTDIEDALNTKKVFGHKVPSGMNVKMQGDFFQRLETLRGLNLSGEQLDKIFPMMARGPGARNAMENLLGREGQSMLAQNRKFFASSDVLETDTAAQDFTALQKAMPTEQMNRLMRSQQSGDEALRASDSTASRDVMFRERFRRRLASQRMSGAQIDAALETYDTAREAGGMVNRAEMLGETAAHFSEIPLVGGMAARVIRSAAPYNVRRNTADPVSDDKTIDVLSRIADSNERMAKQTTAPSRTPLGADTAAGR